MMREVSREAGLGDKIRFVLLISIRTIFSFSKPWMLHNHSHLNRKTIFQGIVLFTADVALCYRVLICKQVEGLGKSPEILGRNM